MIPTKMISTPIASVAGILMFFWLATLVFAQSQTALVGPGETSLEDVFRYAGWLVVILGILAIAAAAIFNAWRKAALNEWKELAEARKGKLVEKELEISKKDAWIAEKDTQIRRLERQNEDLEKKNLRLQDETK